MVYIQETDEYLDFLKSDEYKSYLLEIQFYKDRISYNRFIDIKKFYTIIQY